MRTRVVRSLGLALLLAAVPLALHAQEREITGRTVSAEGAALSDVSIELVGTRRGTFTNLNGQFRITVPAGPVRLRASLIGWSTRTVDVDAIQSDVTITLSTDALNLDEIVVTGTATSVARRNLANAVATVSASELTQTPAASFEQQLAGKIAGADIQSNSGAPGGGIQINLRGVS
ncbi:MAG TPA: carboxypeptidase-like regulatory domain-containing protein, partial [Longimicrobiales bacterium]|nr:carboxypeptidase-like regulatory domain-containing protein [Longimicrobiales bacterium]